jgi:hypothetical protein
MITIRCDYVDANFRLCSAELSGLAFNAKPASWTVIECNHGDHRDYCPEHGVIVRGQGSG